MGETKEIRKGGTYAGLIKYRDMAGRDEKTKLLEQDDAT
jgi:hypothetical protein